MGAVKVPKFTVKGAWGGAGMGSGTNLGQCPELQQESLGLSLIPKSSRNSRISSSCKLFSKFGALPQIVRTRIVAQLHAT
jgi:hypothetical protein